MHLRGLDVLWELDLADKLEELLVGRQLLEPFYSVNFEEPVEQFRHTVAVVPALISEQYVLWLQNYRSAPVRAQCSSVK